MCHFDRNGKAVGKLYFHYRKSSVYIICFTWPVTYDSPLDQYVIASLRFGVSVPWLLNGINAVNRAA